MFFLPKNLYEIPRPWSQQLLTYRRVWQPNSKQYLHYFLPGLDNNGLPTSHPRPQGTNMQPSFPPKVTSRQPCSTDVCSHKCSEYLGTPLHSNGVSPIVVGKELGQVAKALLKQTHEVLDRFESHQQLIGYAFTSPLSHHICRYNTESSIPTLTCIPCKRRATTFDNPQLDILNRASLHVTIFCVDRECFNANYKEG